MLRKVAGRTAERFFDAMHHPRVATVKNHGEELVQELDDVLGTLRAAPLTRALNTGVKRRRGT